jgi:hypothetical protein
MINQTVSEKTIASKFKRLAYFHGMLLTEEDFLDEQNYLREKLKLHNRFHGKGIVQGLEVVPGDQVQCSTCETPDGTAKIWIQPGIALDCEGNEVIVCKPYQVSLQKYIENIVSNGRSTASRSLCNSEGNTLPNLWIGILYGECKSNLMPQYTTVCDAELQEKFSRINEGFNIVVAAECASVPSDWRITETKCGCTSSSNQCSGVDPNCSSDMVIPLAYIKIIGNDSECYNITEDKIVMDGVREYAWTAISNSKWEDARKAILYKFSTKDIDCSSLIGLRKSSALAAIKAQKLESKRQIRRSMLTDTDKECINKAFSIARPGSEVVLVTDDKDENVVFAFPVCKMDKTKK